MQLTDNSPMPFGAHKGKAMVNVPAKYLLWLFERGIANGNVKDYILANINGLRKEAGIK